ncbi:C1 family peptidase [Paludibacterium purpuratum]|uniref:Papain like protease n=1 Tax=Paludibacterium purpuratum TaxID=1144873 RepID=A0A4R7BBK9_9NEIS|nr:C1 family peptidase [Paludibacterium purpuratum]TDR82043.1 papain like protease [Paludibacterium purpuratum]
MPYSIKRRTLAAAFLTSLLLPGWSFAAPSEPATASEAMTASDLAAVAKLARIRSDIQRSAAGWQARLTNVARLSFSAKQRMTGVPEGSHNLPSFTNPAFEHPGAAALPAQYDWRNVSGRNYVSSIKNQGQCGSCWAFAVTAALESKAMINNNAPGSNLDLSEQIVLSCSNAGSCDGGWPDQASKFLVGTGDANERYFRYTAADTACSQAAAGWRNAAYRLKSWKYVVSNATPSVSLLKNALYSSGPLVTTMRVYEDFYYYDSGVYRHTSGDYVGNHAIVIVGWDDKAQAFIVKNSWGTDWGENGFFLISYQELSGDTQFGDQMTLADGPTITPSQLSPAGS